MFVLVLVLIPRIIHVIFLMICIILYYRLLVRCHSQHQTWPVRNLPLNIRLLIIHASFTAILVLIGQPPIHFRSHPIDHILFTWPYLLLMSRVDCNRTLVIDLCPIVFLQDAIGINGQRLRLIVLVHHGETWADVALIIWSAPTGRRVVLGNLIT